MAPERRKLLLLAGLIVGLVTIFALRVRPGTTTATAPASNTRGRTAAAAQVVTAPDVHLEALDTAHPKPDGIDRNLFRFRTAPPGAPSTATPSRPAPLPPARPGPSSPAGVTPIALKFVGFIGTDDGEKIASLSDGQGVVLGKEGTIVLGRYKIWKIGEESIELSYVDGTGRTTIRLTGQ